MHVVPSANIWANSSKSQKLLSTSVYICVVQIYKNEANMGVHKLAAEKESLAAWYKKKKTVLVFLAAFLLRGDHVGESYYYYHNITQQFMLYEGLRCIIG